MQITPAILTDSFLTFQQQLDAVKFSPLIEAVQVDIIDGLFVDNLTITPLDITVADFEPMKIDMHLMTEEPMDFVYECVGVKEYLPIRRIYGQVEKMSHQLDFLHEVKSNSWKAGLALDLFTPLESIDEDAWPELQHILLMGVEAGQQHQKFHPYIIEKIVELREKFPNPERLHIMVDGGVNANNTEVLALGGVDEFAVGSVIWESPEPLMKIEELFTIASNSQE
jgi:ribulose-phosphate 3-epimerase